MSPTDWLTWAFWAKNHEVVRDIVVAVGAVLGSGLLLWRTIATHRLSKAALQQADTASRRHERQTEADTQRRITESFAKAIEQLGNENLEVRLGGIHALARIAKESAADHWPIMETLTAFAREKARLPYPDHEEVARLKKEEQTNARLPPADLQAALIAVAHRCRDHDPQGQQLNLSGTNLSRIDLRQAHLDNANLSGAFLMHALLVEACLDNAYLSGAHLEGAILRFAQLNRASLEGAHLDGADLRGAVLDTAILREATLSNTCLIDADLQKGVVGLTQEQLNEAYGDVTTKLPEGMTIPHYRR